MRHVGSLPEREDASRFTAFLITEGISCKTEEEDDGSWAVWVHDENGVEAARGEFDKFVLDPQNPRYHGLESKAGAILRQEEERRANARRNVVDVRTKWRRPMSGASPFVITLIILSAVVSFTTRMGRPRPDTLGSRIMSHLAFVDARDFVAGDRDPLASIKRGHLWRAVTPIFLHLGALHLLFNMFMLYQLARLLEMRLSPSRLGLIVLIVAVISNTAQALTPEPYWDLMGSPFFGGMSGVVYGLFGYAWIRSIRDPQSGFMLPPAFVFIMLIWLVLCMTPAISGIANTAHLVGLFSGIGLAQLTPIR